VVLYEQKERNEMTVFERSDGRDSFSSYKWAEGFGMKAVAATFWQAQEK